MNQRINIINPGSLINAMEEAKKGLFGQVSSKDMALEQFIVPPLEGYVEPVDFPECCDSHKKMFKIASEYFELFPNCCAQHKKLNFAPWFRKENFSYLPIKILTTINHTNHCILNSLERNEWLKESTDYIKEIIRSYGQLPDGYGPPIGLDLYLFNMQAYIEADAQIPAEKKTTLLEFFKNGRNSPDKAEETDLNLLVSIYKQWIKAFPFDLSFFTRFKPYFQNHLPFIKRIGDTNLYSGLTSFEVVSKNELISFLISATLSIVKEINTQQLYKLGLLQEAESFQVEIILAARKIEMEELDQTGLKDRSQYIKLLKKWLKGELSFLKKIKPYIKKLPPVKFIYDMIDGMRQLQKNDVNEPCIMNVRGGRPDKETSFRYWFMNFFMARYPETTITAEEEKGTGRIDLKIYNKEFGAKIIEFKGWWNRDKENIAGQICKYLTDFEHTGYIFLINDKKEKIDPAYLQIIKDVKSQYVENSLVTHNLPGTDVFYYRTLHKFGVHTKEIFHFIFNVW